MSNKVANYRTSFHAAPLFSTSPSTCIASSNAVSSSVVLPLYAGTSMLSMP